MATLLKKAIQIRWLLRNKSYQELYLAEEITDEKIKQILNALNIAWTPAILTDLQLLASISFDILILTLKYGNSHHAISGYMSYAIYLLNFDYNKKTEDKAYEFGKLAIKLVKKYNSPYLESKYYPIYAFFIYYRRHTIKQCFPYFKKGYISSVNSGNLIDAGFNIHQMFSTLFLSGDYLAKLIKKINNSIKIMRKFHNIDEQVCLNLLKQFYLTLSSAKKDINNLSYQHYKNNDLIEFIKENKLVRANIIFHLYRCYYFFLMKNYQNALIELSALESIIKNTSPGIFLWNNYYFFYSLVIIELFKNFDKKNKKIYFKKLNKFMEIIKFRSASNPENFSNKYYLVKAEYEKLFHHTHDVFYFYLESIKAANNYGLIHEEGIAHELLGQYYLNIQDLEAGKSHLQKAYALFDIWGAKAKTAAMLIEYQPFITETPVQTASSTTKDTTVILGASLNLSSILKASQAISSEIELDVLLRKLLSIIIENSGAHRCFILTKRQSWIIEASGTMEEQEINLTQPSTLEESKEVPITLINYVIRKQKYLVLNDAEHSEFTEADSYLSSAQTKSILIMPIFFQEKLSNIIYLENKSITGAFTQQHIRILQLLSSQAVISLENSRLYYQATHDPLTGLANRNLLNYQFNKNKYLYGKENLICIAFADLDFFKKINDTLGHEAGDKILLQMAKCLNDSTRKEDLVVRLGGDEFLLMLNHLDSSLQAISIIKRLYELWTIPVEIADKKIYISSSIGIAFYPKDAENLDDLMRKADKALYKAKELGRNNYQIYTPTLDQKKNS
jgi:diguanylate cyclase (GGDEF)-like protein